MINFAYLHVLGLDGDAQEQRRRADLMRIVAGAAGA